MCTVTPMLPFNKTVFSVCRFCWHCEVALECLCAEQRRCARNQHVEPTIMVLYLPAVLNHP